MTITVNKHILAMLRVRTPLFESAWHNAEYTALKLGNAVAASEQS